MPGTYIEFTPNQAELDALAHETGLVGQAVARAAGRARDRAKMNLTDAGRVDSGALRNSLRTELVEQSGDRIMYEVGSPLDYAIFVERGTGIYGPHHAPIVPRRARVLRFQPKGSTMVVFASSVRGMEGTRFLERAAFAATAADFAA